MTSTPSSIFLSSISCSLSQIAPSATIKKSIRDSIKAIQTENIGVEYKLEKEEDIKDTIAKLTDEMLEAASKMEFEQAAELRDKIKELEKIIEN